MGLYSSSSSLEKTGLEKLQRKNERGLWSGGHDCYMKREYLSEGRSAVIVIPNFTSTDLDLLQCATCSTESVGVTPGDPKMCGHPLPFLAAKYWQKVMD